jgi:MFS family permease
MTNASGGPDESTFRLSSLTLSTYIPTILFAIGQGAVIPVIPLFARELGSTVAAASLIVALRGLGQLVFDMPAGVAVSKWGDKGAMVAGTVMVATVAVGAAFSSSVLVFGVLVFIMGGGWAFWQLARLAYVTEVTPVEQRGRAMSMLGGMSRVGNFIGPVVGGVLGQAFGLESAFLAQALMGIAAAAMMFMVVRSSTGSEELGGAGLTARIVGTVVDNRRIFLTAGLSTVSLTVLRQARQVFLPLWGEEIGLDVAQIGLVTGISFATDALVFYPSGIIMDRFGRKWAAVPCSVILAASFFILPFTQDIYSFMAVAALSGFGNGLGAGINMTLGADFSPNVGRGEFLGAWRVMADLGGVGGPVVISALTGLGSLALASVASGGIGLAGAAIMVFLVPETLRYRVARRRPEASTGSAASPT